MKEQQTSMPSNKQYQTKQVRDNSNAENRIPSLDRVKRLRSIGKKLLKQKHNIESVFALLATTNETRCDPPLEFSELQELWTELEKFQFSDDETELDGESPTDLDLAKEFVLENTGIVNGMGSWKKYSSGFYSDIDEIQVNQGIIRTLEKNTKYGIRPTGAMVESVKKIAQAEVFIPNNQWNCNPNIIVMKNGLLNLDAWKFEPHNPSFYVTNRLNYDYDPQATCPNFEKYLEETCPTTKDFLQEFSGYCLTTDCSHEISVWLYGPPGCGKSTFIEAVTSMLSDLAGTLSLNRLEKSQFSLGNIAGKTLLFAKESPARFMTTTDILNSLISGEEIDIERKHIQPVTIRSTAKLLWALNELPRAYSGDGIFRRIKLIPFKPFPAERRDGTLKGKVISERAGVLNWALVGLRRLRERGRFEIPAVVKNASENYCASNDVVWQFIIENCRIDEAFVQKKSQDTQFRQYSNFVYSEFRKWCEESDYRPLNPVSFAEGLARYGVLKEKKSGQMVFLGIRVVRSNEEITRQE